MGLDVFWYLPTQGDERYLGAEKGRREPTFSYLTQVTQAVDNLGYGGMLIGTSNRQDTWITAASLIPLTRQLKFLIAVRPTLMVPAVSARMAATFDILSQGRVLLNIVTGGSTEQLQSDGVFEDHDTRYEITDEWLQIWRALSAGETIHFEGKHLRIRNGKQQIESVQKPYPTLYFGGSSEPALDVAAKHVDVYLQWGEPPAQAAEKIQRVRQLAAEKYGRTVRFGMRFHVIARETEAKAWAAAEELIQYVDDRTVSRLKELSRKSESVGQQRMSALVTGRSRADLEIYPNLWAGVGLARGGAGTALVGSPEKIAALIAEYQAIGVDTLVLSGYPALEEAYQFAELVFPLLPLNRPEAATYQPKISVLRELFSTLAPPAASQAEALPAAELALSGAAK